MITSTAAERTNDCPIKITLPKNDVVLRAQIRDMGRIIVASIRKMKESEGYEEKKRAWKERISYEERFGKYEK